MEFREYLSILKQNKRLFLLVVFIVVAAGFFWRLLFPVKLQSVLNLNITRQGVESTQDYRYDNYYRLQADEIFGKTVVRWLESPNLTLEILKEAGIKTEKLSFRGLSRFFKPRQLSAQLIKVTYSAENHSQAEKIGKSLVEAVNKQAEKINQEQKEESWFRIVGESPLTKKDNFIWFKTMLFAFCAGCLLGFWSVLIKHYLKKT